MNLLLLELQNIAQPLVFDERWTKSEGVSGRVWRGRECLFLHCSIIALSFDLSLRMTLHFTDHKVRVVLGIPIYMAVVHKELCDNRSETPKGSWWIMKFELPRL